LIVEGFSIFPHQSETFCGPGVFYRYGEEGATERSSERRMENMRAYMDEIGSPMGQVDFATDEEGSFLGLRFRGGRYHETLEEELERAGFDLVAPGTGTFMRTTGAREQLVEYFAGERRSFDLEVARRGSDFEEAVWEEISRTPFGQTRTYGQVSEAIEGTASAVEVGKACVANPVLLVVPCHRVVGADGALKGYTGGTRLKKRLLVFESSLVLVR
jgi:methylated-DNA-[protein]-cysteine S-methyltransferase